MADFFSFLLDEYVNKIYLLADFFKPKDKVQKEYYFYVFVASSLVTVIVTAAASIEFFSNVKKCLNEIFEYFSKLLTSLFKLVILLISAPFFMVVGFFTCAFVIAICGILFLMPLALISVDYKNATTLAQLFMYFWISLILQAFLYLFAEFGRFIEKIIYYLNGDASSEKTKPVSLFSSCRNFIAEEFSDTNLRNLALKLASLFVMYVIAVASLVPLAILAIWNVIILPFLFIRFLFRGLVRSVRSWLS